MPEGEGAARAFGQWLKAILWSLLGARAGTGAGVERTRLSAEQLVVICLIGGVILVIAVILVSALSALWPG